MQNIQTTPATVTNKTSTPVSVVLESLSTATTNNLLTEEVGISSQSSKKTWSAQFQTWESSVLIWSSMTNNTSIKST